MAYPINRSIVAPTLAALAISTSLVAPIFAQNKGKSSTVPSYTRYLNPATVEELGYCIKISEEEGHAQTRPPELPNAAEVCLAVAAMKSLIRASRNRRLDEASSRASAEVDAPTRENSEASMSQQNQATAALVNGIFAELYKATEMDKTAHLVSDFELLGCAQNVFGAGVYCDYYITFNISGGAGGILDGMGYNNIRERHKGQFIYDSSKRKWREVEMR